MASILSCIQLNIAIIKNNAKFAHRVYKVADEYRSLSLVALHAKCNRKIAIINFSAIILKQYTENSLPTHYKHCHV